MFENLDLYSSRLGALPLTIIGFPLALRGVNFSPWSFSSSSDIPSLSLSLYNQYSIVLTKILSPFSALNFSLNVLNPLLSSGQPSELTCGVPDMVFPSNDNPLGNPSISGNIFAPFKRLVTVAGLISWPSIHFCPLDSIKLVSISFGPTSISSFPRGFSFSLCSFSFSLSSTRFLSDSFPDNLNVTNITLGRFGLSFATRWYFAWPLSNAVFVVVYSYLLLFLDTARILTFANSNDFGASIICLSEMLFVFSESFDAFSNLYQLIPSALYSNPTM